MARDSSKGEDGAMNDMIHADLLPDEILWQQVLARQPGDFLYAVTTMGVYCRPSCPSPRPLRKNARFYASVEAAEADGFRACKRCDPKGERARIAQDVIAEHGSLDTYIWSFVDGKPIVNTWTEHTQVPATTPGSDAMSKALRKRGFRFVGSTICYAFMQATGMVNDHLTTCFRHGH